MLSDAVGLHESEFVHVIGALVPGLKRERRQIRGLALIENRSRRRLARAQLGEPMAGRYRPCQRVLE